MYLASRHITNWPGTGKLCGLSDRVEGRGDLAESWARKWLAKTPKHTVFFSHTAQARRRLNTASDMLLPYFDECSKWVLLPVDFEECTFRSNQASAGSTSAQPTPRRVVPWSIAASKLRPIFIPTPA